VADSKNRFPDELRLKPGVSLSQTRFALANFCLSHFGADGQYYADVIELCADAPRLQEALNIITAEVAKRCPDRLGLLTASVREANDTDLESSGTTLPRAAAPAAAPAPRPVQAPAPRGATPRGATPRGAAPAAPAARPAPAPLQLAPGVSLAQARFALADFCLDQFGTGSQALVDAINAGGDVRAIQGALNRIATEVKEHHRDALEKLLECVREINATSE
jgi:hypothetical protein